MKVEQLLRGKGSKVVTVGTHATIDILARRLRMEKIGAAVVSDDGETVEGIISERDVVNGLAEHGAQLRAMMVSELMTRNVITCKLEDDIGDIMHLMTQKRVRHLPVLEHGKLAGVISIGDVVKNRLEDMQMEANVLRDYIAVRQ
ncbi:MAG: CBS domain-containing protein [Rhizobiales bacterium]|nr:CBS domain-containing protein [Hyphomicrobiales bacterium]